MRGQRAPSERVNDEDAVRLKQPSGGGERPHGILRPVEVREHTREDRQPEPMRVAHRPHVSQRELDPTVVAGGGQSLIGTDSGERPVQQ